MGAEKTEGGQAPSGVLAIRGRIATMDRPSGGTVLADGVVYCRGTRIVAVQAASASPPAGFETISVVHTAGTIFPGLIELHNHLPYDVLSLWQVPKCYSNRDQWRGSSTPDYHRLITGPMEVLGADPDLVAAVVRWVELRALIGGTTTSQGVTLATDPGLTKHFKGLVRNVEAPGDPTLAAAATHVSDVVAADREKFLERISGKSKVILHLSEGIDQAAHDHFAALQDDKGGWAITPNLIGIHCVALTPSDFQVFASHGGSMVWSPFSNLLLYGKTADLGAAIAAKVPISIGSDWTPSGSKNLLGELKVARLAAPGAGADVDDEVLVAMATVYPAQMLGWDKQLGSVQAGKIADLLVVAGADRPPFTSLVDATEADLTLVMIAGNPRVGTPEMMKALGCDAGGETIQVGGQPRILDLTEAAADPSVEAVSAAEAEDRLTKALAGLPDQAKRATLTIPSGRIRLAVEGLVDNEMTPRPHLTFHGGTTAPDYAPRVGALVSSEGGLPALTLDPLAAVDDAAFYATIAGEPNLPPAVRDGLAAFASPSIFRPARASR